MPRLTLPFRHVHRVAVTVVAVGLLITGCGDGGSDEDNASADPAVSTDSLTISGAPTTEPGPAFEPDATVAPNGVTVDVAALDNSFQPQELEVVAGTAVRWENRGRNDHNVLPTDDSQTWGAQTEDFLPGDEHIVVFATPGTYRYYCSIHATKDVGMIGTVVVLVAGS